MVVVHIMNRELKQPRGRWQQERHKFACLTMKNNSFSRFAGAFFIFVPFAVVLVLSKKWNDLFCRCVEDVRIWRQIFNFVFSSPKRWFQFDFRAHFASIMTLNNWEMIAEMQSSYFRWRSRCRRGRLCLNSLLPRCRHNHHGKVEILLSFTALVFSWLIIVEQKMLAETCVELEVEYRKDVDLEG